jgi:hypothetical protein
MKKIMAQLILRLKAGASWFLPKKGHFYTKVIALLLFLLLFFVFSTHVTYANPLGTVVGWVFTALTWIEITIAQLCVLMTIFFLKFFIMIAGYNDYMNAPVVKLGWVLVRDVSNMFFVVALLVIAFATMLGRESYEWKKIMGKLVIVAVFINFSLMLCQLLIDAVHVFTITFLNAIAGTASGNLIGMFHYDQLFDLAGRPESTGTTLELSLFLAASMALVFAGLSMMAMGAYAVMMLLRMVVLWIGMILSPLGFIFSILPATQKYAQEWWQQFYKHLISAPIMVFFLWLALASMGAGDVERDIAAGNDYASNEQIPEQIEVRGQSISASAVSTFINMSSLFVAIGFLLYGLEKTQELGTKGSGMLSGALQFGKKVATIATGYAAGRWLVGGAAGLGAKVGKNFYANLPFIGTRSLKRAGLMLDEFRKNTPYLRKIPIVGGFWEEYGDKLDRRLEKRRTWSKDRRQAQLSHEENYTWLDKVGRFVDKNTGGTMGWGLGRSSRLKNDEEAAYNEAMDQKQKKADQRSKAAKAKYRSRALPLINKFNKEENERMVEELEGNEEKELEGNQDYKNYKTANTQRTNEELEDAFFRDYRKEFNEWLEETAGKAAIENEKTRLGKLDLTPTELSDLFKAQGTIGSQNASNVLDDYKKDNRNLTRSDEEIRRGFLKTDKGKLYLQVFVKGDEAKGIIGQEERFKRTFEAVGGGKTKVYDEEGQELEQDERRGVADTMRAIYFKSRDETHEKELSASESRLKASFGENEYGKTLIERAADAEVAATLGEEFVKQIKNARLAQEYEKATKSLKTMLEGFKGKTGAEMATAIKEALRVGANDFVRVLGQSQITKMEEEASGIRKHQAEDAAKDSFVSMPRYGITSPSTALSDYSESKMKDYRRLDRAAAAAKASNMMATLMAQKEDGRELSIDQQAELNAASSFLQEEAWNDDQGSYVFGMFRKLQAGKLDKGEKKKWQIMAKKFAALGWLDKKAIDKDGNIATKIGNTDYKIKAQYTRKYAADMQALAATGNDTELLEVHNGINEESERRHKAITVKTEEVTRNFIDRKKNADRSGYMTRVDKLKDALVTSQGLDLTKATNEQKVAINARAEQLAEAEMVKKYQNELAEAVKEATKNTLVGYWEIAKDVLPQLKIASIKDVEALQARYDLYADFLQDATKLNKDNAKKTGHAELGYNQDFDEEAGIYRFQTVAEGEKSMKYERVKMKPRQLVTSDQFHSNGILDFDTGLVDDFLEDVLGTTLGKIVRYIDISDINMRSLLGHFYLHKDEEAQTVTHDDGKQYAVVGGDKMRQKMIDAGEIEVEKQEAHMLLRGIMPEMLAGNGGKGWVYAAKKLFDHLDDDEIESGEIRVDVAGKKFKRMKDIADRIVEILKADIRGASLVGTNYEGRREEVLRRMGSIQTQWAVTSNKNSEGGGGKDNRDRKRREAEAAGSVATDPDNNP